MQGDNVTTGLKKVTDDMKTKNRADRTGAVPSSAPTSAPTASKGAECSSDNAPTSVHGPVSCH